MKRSAAVLLLVALVAGGCSSDGDDGEDAAPSTSTTSTVSTSTSAPAVECNGLGPAPATGQGEVTWIADGRLWAVGVGAGAAPRCLREVGDGVTTLQWGGAGDRVLVNGSVTFADARVVDAFKTDGALLLSRPKGTSVILAGADGKLLKRELDKGERPVTFMDRHESAVYHPAGTHIVSWGDNVGTPRLVIADNNGGNARDVVTNESGVKAFSGVAFTASGALLYVADHGDHVDMHRLVIGEDTFSTITTIKAPGTLRDVTTSSHEGGGVAWTAGDCASEGGAGLVAQRDGKYFEGLKGTAAERARPVGWLPDRSLVAIEGGACERSAPGRVVVIRDAGAKVEVLPARSAVVAVRAALPPPPAPPKDIPQQAPA